VPVRSDRAVHGLHPDRSLFRPARGAIIRLEYKAMALEIRIIGKGCFFCNELKNICDGLVAEMAVGNARVEQVHDVDALLDFGVVNPPALVVNGKLKMMGRVLVRGRVRRAIEEEMAASPDAASAGPGDSAPQQERGAWQP